MTFILRPRAALRRANVPAFIRHMSERHPELLGVVSFADAVTMAKRDGVTVRAVTMADAQDGRLVRIWGGAYVLVNRAKTRVEQTMAAMHELCHFWRDDPGVSSYYSDGETGGASDEFADIFAWTVTSPERFNVVGLRPQDLPGVSEDVMSKDERDAAIKTTLRRLRMEQL